MTTETAREILRNAAWLGTDEERDQIEQAVEVACGELCGDAISRAEVHDLLATWISGVDEKTQEALEVIDGKIEDMTSVTPKQRTGHWIKRNNPNYSPFDGSQSDISICSECGLKTEWKSTKFCPNCGAKMEEQA